MGVLVLIFELWVLLLWVQMYSFPHFFFLDHKDIYMYICHICKRVKHLILIFLLIISRYLLWFLVCNLCKHQSFTPGILPLFLLIKYGFPPPPCGLWCVKQVRPVSKGWSLSNRSASWSQFSPGGEARPGYWLCLKATGVIFYISVHPGGIDFGNV